MTDMDAEILVRINVIPLPDNEPTKRPVALANLELATARVRQFVEPADSNFGGFTARL
jgi:hypothetical protein